MAEDSLIDFSGPGRLGLGFLNYQVQDEQNQLYQQRSKNNETLGKLNVLMKMADDPVIRADTKQLDGVLTLAGQLAGVPEISPESLSRSRTYIRDMMDGMASSDVTKSHEALLRAAVTFKPDDMDRYVKAVENAPVMREKLRSMQALRQVNEQKFDRVDQLTAQIGAGERPLTQAVTDFSTILHGTDTPDFRSVVKGAKILQRMDGTTRADLGSLAQSPKTKAFQSQAFQQDALVAGQAAERLNTLAGETETLLTAHANGGDLPAHTTKRDLEARLAIATTLGDAYTTLGQWAKDPFHGEKLKAAKAAEKTIVAKRAEIEELKKTDGKMRTEIAQDSLTFRQSEAGQKHAYSTAVGNAQAEVLERHGRTPSTAELASIARKHGVKPEDVLPGLADPAKRNTLAITTRELPKEVVTADVKAIQGERRALRFASALYEKIKNSPAIVGKGAQIGAAVAGAGQQLRSIAGLDPVGTRFIDTKKRDELEALHEIAVYLQAKSMDPTGALDIKVVQHARDTIGDISSWTTGPVQMLNKLKTVMDQYEIGITEKQRDLKGGMPSILGETVEAESQAGSSGQATQPGSPRTAEEYLKQRFGIE